MLIACLITIRYVELQRVGTSGRMYLYFKPLFTIAHFELASRKYFPTARHKSKKFLPLLSNKFRASFTVNCKVCAAQLTRLTYISEAGCFRLKPSTALGSCSFRSAMSPTKFDRLHLFHEERYEALLHRLHQK